MGEAGAAAEEAGGDSAPAAGRAAEAWEVVVTEVRDGGELYVQRADTTGVFWDIRGSPFPVAVSTGPTNPFVSRLVGRHEVVAGEEAAFTLMTRDEFGNAPAGGEVSKFAVEAVHAKKGVAQAMAKLLDAGRGNYTVQIGRASCRERV